ncbi:MAG TPA: long-chain fatty acid--CoA ligase [Kineosporiaceae bacterium]
MTVDRQQGDRRRLGHDRQTTLSVAAIAAQAAARHPGRPAIVLTDGRVLTCGQLWWRAQRVAALLREHAVRPGAPVALLMSNSPDFPAMFFGVLIVGAVAVPLNPLLRAGEIRYILGDCQARLLLCAPELVDLGRRGAAGSQVTVLGLGADEHRGRPGPADHGGQDGYLPRHPLDVAMVLYTSGTTGQPKGAQLTHLNLTMNVLVTAASPFELTPDDVLLGCLPLFHVFGLVCGLLTCLQAGATLVLMPRFDAASALALLAERRCTVFMGVPAMYHALLEAASRAPTAPLRLRRAYSGGSALPVEVMTAFREVFGCPVYEGYGLTETSPVVAYNHSALPVRPGTVGHPIWGVEVAIARAEVEDRIVPVPAGEVGEIIVRGHNVMAGYLHRQEATAEVIVDGWFRSGDLGRRDDEGYLSIIDRKKDLIIRNGYNVYPREVEEVLLQHPAVSQVAVIGLPHPSRGEEICAFVIQKAGLAPDDQLAQMIIDWARNRLAAYKFPRRLEFVQDFPLGPSGKILKRELAARRGGATEPGDRPDGMG